LGPLGDHHSLMIFAKYWRAPTPQSQATPNRTQSKVRGGPGRTGGNQQSMKNKTHAALIDQIFLNPIFLGDYPNPILSAS
jgi:hypothetical protein